MSIKDKKQRVGFAHKMLKCYEADEWRNDINLYLDGVGFVHRTNPQDQAMAPGGEGGEVILLKVIFMIFFFMKMMMYRICLNYFWPGL